MDEPRKTTGLFGVRKSQIPVEIGLSPIETDKGFFVFVSVMDISAHMRVEHISKPITPATFATEVESYLHSAAISCNQIVSRDIVETARRAVSTTHPLTRKFLPSWQKFSR